MKKFLAILLVMLMVLPTCLTAFAAQDSYDMFIGFGGDKNESGDWGWGYDGGEAAEGLTATNANIAVGETATISLEFDTPVVYTWWCAPCLAAGDDNIVNVDADITVAIDGTPVDIDLTAGDLWWAEGTGETGTHRLAGGYNEWGAHYIESPAGFTKIEYTITLNSVEVDAAPAGTNVVESDAVFDMFIGFGGDKNESGDWGWGYDGGFAEGVTATNAAISAGETATISLEFETPVVYTWWCAPCIAAGENNIVGIDADIAVAIDGNPVDIDFTAGDLWWAEGTGEAGTHRLAGGYNEWAAQYISSPSGFTKIEYTITLNSVKVAAPEEIDVTQYLDGEYNAYIQFQTDVYTFRNNWDDGSYGLGTENFDVTTAWAADGSEIHYDSTFNDTKIVGNGTYTVGVIFNEDTASLNGSNSYNMLQVSTDIPSVAVKSASNENGVIEITDVKTSFDGGDNKSFTWVDTEGDYAVIMVLNTYNDNVGTEAIPYVIPEKSIDITFTVSGMTNDAPVADVDDTETPAEVKGDSSNVALIACIAGGLVIVLAAVILGVVLGKSKKAAKAEEAPAEKAVVEEAPVEETVAEEAPVEETVAEEAPVEETVAEEAPVEETVAEEAPVEETVVEEAPAEETEE